MELVVGASEATMRSLLGKLGDLLSQEYTLIRGVDGDLQYINDELATMQSFLRSGGASHGDLMKDWMKQIRDITYDIEDCIDDSGHRLHGIPTTMPCYFFLNSVYEILRWWPRRHLASRISVLKMRAQQIGERRDRYGVNNTEIGATTTAAGFEPADNQGASMLQLITMKDPVGVEVHMEKLHKRVTCIVGFGGVGKTAIATALYSKIRDNFSHSAMVTVSQSSDVEAILRNINSQVKAQATNREQKGGPAESRVTAAVKGVRVRINRGTLALMTKCFKARTSHEVRADTKPQLNKEIGEHLKRKRIRRKIGNRKYHIRDRVKGGVAVMTKCCSTGTSQEILDGTKQQLKQELEQHFDKKSYLILIDDVWSANMLEKIINALPDNEGNRIIVTTRFHAVATARREGDIRKIKGLVEEQSKKLFEQAFFESQGSKSKEDSASKPTRKEGNLMHNVDKPMQVQAGSGLEGGCDVVASTPNRKKGHVSVKPVQSASASEGSKNAIVPDEPECRKDVTGLDEVWKMCGGLPLAIVTMAGHVACNPRKSPEEWSKFCSSVFPDSGKDGWKELTQEEVGTIISHCYNDMPAEIKTCSMYLSIFPKGHKISKKRLIRRWIAEGFVCEKQGLSVEDVAETYFNHLVRRKMIIPVEHSSNGKVKRCIVHDMVLEHIVAKASEENFITVVGGNWLMQPPGSKVRRLCLQGSDSRRAKDTDKMNLSHVRSVTMFGSLNSVLPSHSFKFGIVQVLDLESCTGFKQHHTKEICRMLLLKYLSLRKTDIKRLPDKVGKLKNLETLDIRETNVTELPNTVCLLERLANILGGNKTTRKALKLPEGLTKKKKMKALRILSGVEIVEGSDLHHLTELRKLAIYKLKTMWGDASFKELRSSIEYLGGYSLHTLIIDDESSQFIKSLDDLSSPPKFLVALELSGKMVKLPSWMKKLYALNKLTLSVTALRTDNLEHLSKLEALFSLTFSFRPKQKDREIATTIGESKQDREIPAILAENKLYSHGEITVPDGGFTSLKLLRLSAPLLPLLCFSGNAMPNLERLELKYNMLEGLFGAENLAELKEVHLTSDYKAGKDKMTKQIRREMKSAAQRTGGTMPKIILHQ